MENEKNTISNDGREQFIGKVIGDAWKYWCGTYINVFLLSGTGSGKTTFYLNFALEELKKPGKRALILAPRSILAEQIDQKIKEILSAHPLDFSDFYNRIDVSTYQYIEVCEENSVPFPDYDLVICDEFHTWISDSLFNSRTELSYRYITRHSGLKVYVSATAEDILDFMENDLDIKYEPEKFRIELKCFWSKKYLIQPDYSYLDVKYFVKDDELIELLKSTKGKTLVFVSSKKKGEEICDSLKEAKIPYDYISADNKETEAYGIIKSLVKKEMFSKKVLVTTSVMDVGINLEDEELENIVIKAFDKSEMLQMLGRIRHKDENYRLNLYIYAQHYTVFENLLEKCIEPVMKAINYLDRFRDENYNCSRLLTVYGREDFEINDNIRKLLLYNKNNTLYLNRLSCYIYTKLFNIYTEICKGLLHDRDYFIKKQLQWLGLEDTFSINNFYSLEICENRRNELIGLIREKIPEFYNGLTLLEMKNVIQDFKKILRDIDPDFIRSNQELSYKKFNDFCKIYDIPFEICKAKQKKERHEMYILNEKPQQ